MPSMTGCERRSVSVRWCRTVVALPVINASCAELSFLCALAPGGHGLAVDRPSADLQVVYGYSEDSEACLSSH
eukprot:6492525-Amphidinium_carterae.3